MKWIAAIITTLINAGIGFLAFFMLILSLNGFTGDEAEPGLILLVWIFRSGNWIYFPLCLVVGYGFAWFAHFFVEHNKPATFKYPLWSFVSDYKMMWFMLTGRMNAEVERVRTK
jgi:hypothetical protein